MEKYEPLSLDIVKLSTSDVITASGGQYPYEPPKVEI